MSAMIERVGRKLSGRSNHAWAHHACLVTKGGNVVSFGANQNGAHAEAIALYRLPQRTTRNKIDASGHVLWSMRFNASGSFGNAKPCANCEAMIRACGIRTVVYSTPQGFVKMRLRVGEEQ